MLSLWVVFFICVVVDMELVPLTAAGIAVATGLGAVLGDRLGALRGRWTVLLRAAGVLMLGVIIIGVLQPLREGEQGWTLMILLVALICLAEILGSRLERNGSGGSTKRLRSLLFVSVIALHHFPEGMAAGMSCVNEGAAAVAVCAAVVLHSIPESMIIPPTMQAAGYRRIWGYAAAAVSGGMEILGVLVGAWI